MKWAVELIKDDIILDTVILDSEKLYSGMGKLVEREDKLVRKAIGLPVTKQLVFYTDQRDAKSIVNVINYQLVEMYDISEKWYMIDITLSNGQKVRIHSRYFIEMQKPSFITDMLTLIQQL